MYQISNKLIIRANKDQSRIRTAIIENEKCLNFNRVFLELLDLKT